VGNTHTYVAYKCHLHAFLVKYFAISKRPIPFGQVAFSNFIKGLGSIYCLGLTFESELRSENLDNNL